MRSFLAFIMAMGFLLATNGPIGGIAFAATGPDGTPQVEAQSETQRYTEAALSQLLTQYWVVLYETDALPQYPSPDQVKASQLRKRLLDLRLILDLNAFAYEPGKLEAYRGAIDEAYEEIGQYKDLFDVQKIDGAPIDPTVAAERLAKMNVALAPFRLPSFREDLNAFFYERAATPLSLAPGDRPRLWQIAQVTPNDNLTSAGNAALLVESLLRNLSGEGLTVADIFDPAQEERFHDVRKALRSALVLVDMFPSLSAQTAEVREPLAELVDDYGDTNDALIAYRAAQESGRQLDERAAAVSEEFAKAQARAAEFVEGGQLEAYASRLGGTLAGYQR